LINITEIVLDPDFAQPAAFTVYRTTGTWTGGRFVSTAATLQYNGSIIPMTTKEMQQLPQGDQVTGAVVIYTPLILNTTRLDQNTLTTGGTSDEILWQGERWKILNVRNFVEFGYYRATAVRKLAA